MNRHECVLSGLPSVVFFVTAAHYFLAESQNTHLLDFLDFGCGFGITERDFRNGRNHFRTEIQFPTKQ
jgi:hypothetical protein